MPYKSKAQQRFFHSAGAKKAGISQATVAEFDSASKGMKLPMHAKSMKSPMHTKKMSMDDKAFVKRMKKGK